MNVNLSRNLNADSGTQGNNMSTSARRLPIGFTASGDQILQNAYRSHADEYGAIQTLTADKRELLRHYDAPGMETAVALCFWGRSGSYLLASYLDGHDGIVMLPMIAGEGIYPFFQNYESLSV